MAFLRALYARKPRTNCSSYVKDKIANGRILLTSLFRLKFAKPNKSIRLQKLSEKKELLKRITPLKPSLVQRIISRCSSDTFAAILRRNAAKELMCAGGMGVPVFCFVGLSLARGPTLLDDRQRLEAVPWEIRNLFSDYAPSASAPDCGFSGSLDDFEIGGALAKGCSAVVHAARVKGPASDVRPPVGSLGPYDVAVKVMFNYDAESNAVAIWNAMNRETVPARYGVFGEDVSGATGGRKRLPPHANLVDMYFAFVDEFPSLPGAMESFPDALPSKLNKNGLGRNATLFLVMKRYHCTLGEFLRFRRPSSRTSLLLFAQLLEGVCHLVQNDVSHRDLKLDNVLLDLSQGPADPHLVIADFGCCFSGRRLKLRYFSEEISRGGNAALMPPEVITAEPGFLTLLDYSRADLWTAGTLAYDIFGGENPFCSNSDGRLKSYSYAEKDLPALPERVPPVLKKLIMHILRRDFRARPGPTLAATVCQILILARPRRLERLSSMDCREVLEWLVNNAGITICRVGRRELRRPVEHQLRVTFFSRFQLSEVLEALEYISSE